MNAQAQQATVAPETVTTVMDPKVVTWLAGFSAYARGESFYDMPTELHRKGWRAANEADAALSAEQYLGKAA